MGKWAVLDVVEGSYVGYWDTVPYYIWSSKLAVNHWLDSGEKKYPGFKLRYIAVNLDEEQVKI